MIVDDGEEGLDDVCDDYQPSAPSASAFRGPRPLLACNHSNLFHMVANIINGSVCIQQRLVPRNPSLRVFTIRTDNITRRSHSTPRLMLSATGPLVYWICSIFSSGPFIFLRLFIVFTSVFERVVNDGFKVGESRLVRNVF